MAPEPWRAGHDTSAAAPSSRQATLSGHGKPVSLLAWNPVASNVIASVAKDPSVKIWDVERGVAGATIDGFGALIQVSQRRVRACGVSLGV